MIRARDVDYDLIPETVIDLCRRLQEAGFEAYVVGGSVRDLLLGRPVQDWDVTTAARPEEVQALFRRTIPTGIQHGTVTVLRGDEPIEVTTFRGEGAYSDGRRPDSVEFVSELERDLERRDFTINAMALDPVARKLADPLDGQGDLLAGVLRAVGDPRERFDEDGLRALRAVRFAALLDLEIDPPTLAAIPATMARFRCVSAERVRDELLKLLMARIPSRGIELLRETGLLAEILPELLPCIGLTQNAHHEDDVYRHTLRVLDALPADAVLRLAGLLHDVAKPLTAAPRKDDPSQNSFHRHEQVGAELCDTVIARRLKLSNEDRQRLCHLVRHHLFGLDAHPSKAALRRLVRRVGPASVDDLFALREADIACRPDGRCRVAELHTLRERVGEILSEPPLLSVRDLAIDGEALMAALSRPPGRWIGETLRRLLERTTEDPSLNTQERLLALAQELNEEDGGGRG